MDFMNRGQQSNGTGRPNTVFSASTPNDTSAQSPLPTEHGLKQDKTPRRGLLGASDNKWYRWGGSAAVVIIALLIGAALALFLLYRPSTEGDLVDSSKLQAVFLTNDQVYFGHITAINGKYVVLTNIYYLQTAATGNTKTATNNSNVSLVKLGCELHKPQDRMVIQQDQINFWENLQSDGQVAKAVKNYEDSGNNQTCSTNSANTNPVQGGSTNTTPASQTQTDKTKQ